MTIRKDIKYPFGIRTVISVVLCLVILGVAIEIRAQDHLIIQSKDQSSKKFSNSHLSLLYEESPVGVNMENKVKEQPNAMETSLEPVNNDAQKMRLEYLRQLQSLIKEK